MVCGAMKKVNMALCASLLTAFADGASAQVSRVTSRMALGGDLTIDWHAFGADGRTASTPVSRRFGAEKVTLASSSGSMVVRREGTTWHGDFLPGQYLMTQPYPSDTFQVAFSPPVMAVGTQIDPGSQQGSDAQYTGYFVARIRAYGVKGDYLGMVQRASTADANETGSARFLGVRSAGQPIGYVSLMVSGVTPGFSEEGDLAVNQMDVVMRAGGE
jgi:hypothetical protein